MRFVPLTLLTLAACASAPLRIDCPPIGPNEEAIGLTKGTASGFMLLSLIPLGQNDRFEEAYDRAMRAVDAARLTNITVSESWYYCGIGNLYVFTVEGTGVRVKR